MLGCVDATGQGNVFSLLLAFIPHLFFGNVGFSVLLSLQVHFNEMLLILLFVCVNI